MESKLIERKEKKRIQSMKRWITEISSNLKLPSKNNRRANVPDINSPSETMIAKVYAGAVFLF